jgi:hypothetical protein
MSDILYCVSFSFLFLKGVCKVHILPVKLELYSNGTGIMGYSYKATVWMSKELWFRSRQGLQTYLFPKNILTGSDVHPFFYAVCTGDCVPGDEGPDC